MEDTGRDRQRAEVFDALAHPTRISILKVLSEEPLGFADLKKRMGTESSGHLQHHLSKLDGLIETDEHGKYCLSDQGKDALFAVQTVEKVFEPKVRPAGAMIRSYSLKTRMVLTSIIVLLTAASIVSGLFISTGGIAQSQYFYDVVVGSPLKDGLSIGGSFEILPKSSFNYTAVVFFHSVGYGYAGKTYSILDVLLPPFQNSTFYRQSFVGFEMDITASTVNMDIFFRPAIAPNGRAAEEVTNPYGFPPYNTTTSTGLNATIGPTIPFGWNYIVPANVEGNYTFSLSNTGNSIVNGTMTVWPSVVTMETKLLDAGAFSQSIADAGYGQIARVYSKPTYPTYMLPFATAGLLVSSLGVGALCVYVVNRKR